MTSRGKCSVRSRPSESPRSGFDPRGRARVRLRARSAGGGHNGKIFRRGSPVPARDIPDLVPHLRREAFPRRVADALRLLQPPTLNLEIVGIGQLPLYNQDDDKDSPPSEWVEFRERMRGSDAVFFVTPEYNRSIPAALKNAIDVASRPYGKSAWEGKPCAVVSNSPGAVGGFGAN